VVQHADAGADEVACIGVPGHNNRLSFVKDRGDIMPSYTPSSHPLLSYADQLAVAWQDFLILCGRILMGWIFLQSGWRKVMDIAGFVKTMPRRDLPEFLGYVAPWVEVLCGALILLGAATRYAALLVLLFTIIATFSSHRYWNFPEAQQANQSSHFWKNISMMGGQILLFVTGAGRFSLDALLRRK
jgi:putative oxidoreductase